MEDVHPQGKPFTWKESDAYEKVDCTISEMVHDVCRSRETQQTKCIQAKK